MTNFLHDKKSFLLFMFEHFNFNESDAILLEAYYTNLKSRSLCSIKEITQAQFNRAYQQKADYDRYMSQGAISIKDKQNLRYDIDAFKKEFNDLKRTAAELPDSYVSEICNTNDYPFEEPVDEVENVNTWCNEVDEFLKQDIESFGMNFTR